MDYPVEVDGDLYPDDDKGQNLGGTGSRWKDAYIYDLHEGDVHFYDTHCPICQEEFQKEDVVVFYAYKKNEEMKEICTIPIHLKCANKEKNNERIEAFKKEKEKLSDQLIQDKLKRDPITINLDKWKKKKVNEKVDETKAVEQALVRVCDIALRQGGLQAYADVTILLKTLKNDKKNNYAIIKREGQKTNG